ncbi:MAG TPA: hypothetical protein VNG69_03845 [Casimicrobiaceae bacterium]|nr:hypothetical protein [Casimicrobiaceae bacterium]
MTRAPHSQGERKRAASVRTALVLWGIALTFFIATIASRLIAT